MKRREFMTLLGGAAVAWPLAARAQQQGPVSENRHTHAVSANTTRKSKRASRYSGKSFASLAGEEGDNLRIDERWSAEATWAAWGPCRGTGEPESGL